jgi:hypothetical protein
VFRTRVSDHGLHAMAFILVGVGAIVLVMVIADRELPTRVTG